MRHLMAIALAALAASAPFFSAGAEEGDFVLRGIVGRAEGTGFTARHQALQAARQEVIWRLLESYIASGDLRPYRVMVRNADAYFDRVVELRVDSEGGQTRVEIDAYVDIRALELDLATHAKPRLAVPPKVACLIGERAGDGPVVIEGVGLAEQTMVEGLKKLELEARDHFSNDVRVPDADLLVALGPDLERAAAYARETLADAVVIGVVTVERGPDQDQAGTAKTRATLEARVFRGSDGDLLEVFARSAAITGKDAEACREEAITDVATKMLGDVTVTTVLSVLGSQKRDEVLITLLNPGTRDRMSLFTGLLAQDNAIHSVEEAYFSERSARVRLGYDGPMSYLVDLLSDKSFDGWVVEVQEAFGIERTMNLVLVPMGNE